MIPSKSITVASKINDSHSVLVVIRIVITIIIEISVFISIYSFYFVEILDCQNVVALILPVFKNLAILSDEIRSG